MIRDQKIICRKFLDFIKSKSCLGLGVHIGPIDPHHLIAVGWRQAKRNDFTVVPLCRKHHGEVEQVGVSKFEATHNVDLWRENSMLLIEWFTCNDDPAMRRIKK